VFIPPDPLLVAEVCAEDDAVDPELVDPVLDIVDALDVDVDVDVDVDRLPEAPPAPPAPLADEPSPPPQPAAVKAAMLTATITMRVVLGIERG
jgi:hypothetical protein